MAPVRRQHAPFFATSLPGWVMDGLRAAGVMIAEWTSQQWRADSHKDYKLNALLLFDSRTPVSRDAAEAAAARGFTTLNLAPLIHDSMRAIQSNLHDTDALPFAAAGTQELPARLQQEITACGFLWARIADYPYPYQAALVDGSATQEGDSVGATDESELAMTPVVPLGADPSSVDSGQQTSEKSPDELAISDIEQRYALGQAMYLPPEQTSPITSIIARALRNGRFPLLWKITPETFRNWRESRKRVRVSIESMDDTLQIQCEMPFESDRPALELWRGTHFAALPLSVPQQTVEERSLIFQSAARRHQAGLAAFSAATRSVVSPSSIAVTHAL